MTEHAQNSRGVLATVLSILVPIVLAAIVAYGYFTGLSIQVLLPILLGATVVLLLAVFLILRLRGRRRPADPGDLPS